VAFGEAGPDTRSATARTGAFLAGTSALKGDVTIERKIGEPPARPSG
jgi:hypothetical protein